MKTLIRLLSLSGLLLALAAPALAQGERLTLKAHFDPAVARPGETVKLVLEAEVEFGYHAYGQLETTNIPVTLPQDRLQLGGLEAVGAAQIPDGDAKEVFGQTQYPLPEVFEVTQLVRVPIGAAAAEFGVAGELAYQVCDENSCDPPAEAAFSASLTVEAGEVRAEYAGTAKATKPGLQLVPEFGDEHFALVARFEPAVARRGETVQLVLEGHTEFGWHAYGTLETANIPISLPIEQLWADGLELVGDPVIPEGDAHEVFGQTQYPLPEIFEVRHAMRVPDDKEVGTIKADGLLNYQVCDENGCLPEAAAEFEAELVIEAGEARSEYVIAAPARVDSAEPEPETEGAKNGVAKPHPFGGFWGLMLLCVGGGLFALAMPCTYPMIPITFSFFTKQAEVRGGNVLPLAVVYGAGIVSIFMLVGVIAMFFATLIGDVVNHWVTNAIIGLAFLFFAMTLFGWINMQPPQFMQRLSGKASQTGGLIGVFFMGAALVITSFTCTAPIVGAVLPKAASLGWEAIVGMGVFGLTMAIPFVALALMPTRVKAMPRSGEWMETLKISLGFVELAAVFKFLSMIDISLGLQVLNRELFLLLTGTILLLWAMFLFGFLRKAGQPYAGVGPGRQGTGMVVVLLAVYLFSGAMGHRLDFIMTSFAPAYSAEYVTGHASPAAGGNGGHEAPSKGHVIVYDNPAEALQVAQQQDKLLIYNFTGFN